MIYAILFPLGAIFGSFLNVCISRLPLQKSVIFPGSACPNCKHPIKACHNIPIISYFMLKGKCAACKWPIPGRYLLVEILSGGILILLYKYFKITPLFFLYTTLCFYLIVITFIDIEHKLILNKLTLPGIVIGISLSLITRTYSFTDILAGIATGGGLLLLAAVLGKIVFRKESMGAGDIKLAAMIGSFLGFNGMLISLLIAFTSGAVIGVILAILYKTKYIPFGPFLSLGAVISIFIDEYNFIIDFC